MTVNEQVLEILPIDEAKAMNARELYALCTWAESVNQVSTALSQLFNAGTISRKEAASGHATYVYWNHPAKKQETPVKSTAPETRTNPKTTEQKPRPVDPIGAMVDSIVDRAIPLTKSDTGNDVKEAPQTAAHEVKSYPSIKIDAQIQIPDMPNTLKVIGIKPETLDDAYATGGNFTIDVAALDDAAVDSIIDQWAQKFKAHVRARKNSN